MLEELKFVTGAVATKDFVPELMHFLIKGGRVTAFNGQIALSSDIDCDIQAKPRATALINAVKACNDQIVMSMTPKGRLSVKSGKFKTFVPCLETVLELTEYQHAFVQPEGTYVDVDENFMAGIKALSPFVGQDASRPWATGIRIHGQSMFATNNICLVEYWHGIQMPHDVVIPALAIKELLRIGQAPTAVKMGETSMTFFFGTERWLRTQLIGQPWPEVINTIFDNATDVTTTLPENLGTILDDLKPFCDHMDRVYLRDGRVTTGLEDEVATVIENEEIAYDDLIFNRTQLRLVCALASKVNLTLTPAHFVGERARGVIIGMTG